MTIYTRGQIAREAASAVKEIRRETGHPARLVDWRILLNGANPSLVVTVAAYDGHRERYVAI